MHIFTTEDLQNALDLAKNIQDEEKDEENEEWRNIFVEILRTFELGGKAFETGHAQREIAEDGIGEYQKTMNDYRSDYTIVIEQALLSYKNGEYQKVIDYSRKALAIAKKVGKKEREGEVFGLMGAAYSLTGEYQKAIYCHRKSLEIYEELGDKEGIGRAQMNMGMLYIFSGEYQKSIDYHRKQLDIAEELGDKREIGAGHRNLGIAYQEIDEYQKAINCYRKHVEIAEELGDKVGIGIAYANMGNAYKKIGEYQKAIDCYCKDLETAEELGNKGGIDRAHANMGNAYNDIGEYQKAIDCHRKHFEIAEELGDKEGIGIAHRNMGIAYSNIGEHQKAINCHRKDMEIAEELGDKEGVARAYGNMGNAYNDVGEYQKAIDCHRKALEITEELGDKRGIGRAHGNMGIAYQNIREYQKAIDCHRKELEIAEELGDKKRTGIAHGHIGGLYGSIGEYHKEIDCHRKHLKIAEELSDKGGIGRANANLGIAYTEIGKYQTAIDYHRKHLEIAKELNDKGGIGRAHGNMGNVYYTIGEYQKAIDYHCKHLEIAEELGDNEGVGRAYGNMGNAYERIGEYQKAIDCSRKALEIAEELGDIRTVAMAQTNLGNYYYRKNIDRLACSFYAMSMLSYQKIRDSGVYEDELNTSVSNLFAKLHKIFLESLLNLKQVKSALLVSDSGKAKALYDLTRRCVDVVKDFALDEYFTIAMQAIANEPCLKANEVFFDIVLYKVIYLMQDENIVSYTFDHDDNLHAWVISRKGVFHKTWKTENGMSTKAYGETLNHEIRECLMRNLPKNVFHSPGPAEKYGFGGNAQKNHLDFPCTGNKDDRGNKFTRDLEERVRNLTRIDKTSLETINCDPNISVLKSLKGRYNLDGSTTNQHGFHNSSQKSREENEKYTKKVVGRYSLERANVTHGRVKNGTDHRAPQLEKDAFQTSLEKLYSIYISPIEEYLVGSKILVVPEGSLFEVPFCALLNSKKEHLCDRYSLQYTPALHVLNTSLLKPLPKIGPALFVGNPIVGDVKFNDVLGSLPQLPDAKVEAEECSKYFKAELLLEEKATKENVLKSMKDASVIHIAAHGDMDHADIFLAPNEGAPKPPNEEHYLLTAKDVVECTLKARLVVLSCCHSGRGQISAEGVVGIARSFLGAGARSVLVSLWEILDEETMELMKLFYEKVIQGVSVCVALQQTMIEMKKKYGMAAWSYFQIVGEDISLSKDEIEEIRRQSSAR